VLRGSLADRMLAESRQNGPESGAAVRDGWRKLHPNPWSEGLERRPQRFAGELLDAGKPADAAAIAEALVTLEPNSYLAWRTLGEAKAALGDRARAVEALRRALQANPRGETARVMLERLGGKP